MSNLITVNTNKLRIYSTRLSSVDSRLQNVNQRLDTLFGNSGILGVRSVRTSHLNDFPSRCVRGAVSYLNDTASSFDRTEREINNSWVNTGNGGFRFTGSRNTSFGRIRIWDSIFLIKGPGTTDFRRNANIFKKANTVKLNSPSGRFSIGRKNSDNPVDIYGRFTWFDGASSSMRFSVTERDRNLDDIFNNGFISFRGTQARLDITDFEFGNTRIGRDVRVGVNSFAGVGVDDGIVRLGAKGDVASVSRTLETRWFDASVSAGAGVGLTGHAGWRDGRLYIGSDKIVAIVGGELAIDFRQMGQDAVAAKTWLGNTAVSTGTAIWDGASSAVSWAGNTVVAGGTAVWNGAASAGSWVGNAVMFWR